MGPSLTRGAFFTQKASLESKGLPVVRMQERENFISSHWLGCNMLYLVPLRGQTCSVSQARPSSKGKLPKPKMATNQSQGKEDLLPWRESKNLTKSGTVGTYTISHTLYSPNARGV